MIHDAPSRAPGHASVALGSPYTLRPSVPADFEFVFEVNKANMRAIVEMLRPWDDESEREEMRSFFSPGIDRVIVVDSEDAGHLRVSEEPTRTHLRMIALLPRWQRLGIGTRIIRDLMHASHERGVPLTLWVSELNHGALRLYRRLGFKALRSVHFGPKGVKIEMSVEAPARGSARS